MKPIYLGVKYFLMGLVASTIWSGWIILTKQSTSDFFTPIDIAAIRFFTSGILLSPILFKMKKMLLPFWKNIILMVSAGFIQTSIITSGIALIEQKYIVIMYASISSLSFLLNKRFLINRIISFVISISTIIYVIHQPGNLCGKLMLIIGGSLLSYYSWLTRKWQVPSSYAISIVSCFSFVIFLPIYLGHKIYTNSITEIINWPLKEVIAQAIYQGILSPILALWLFTRATNYFGSYKGSLFTTMAPLISLFIKNIIYQEKFNASELTVIILLSAIVITGWMEMNQYKKLKQIIK